MTPEMFLTIAIVGGLAFGASFNGGKFRPLRMIGIGLAMAVIGIMLIVMLGAIA